MNPASRQPASKKISTFSMVGYGAVGRPLARGLMRRGIKPMGIALQKQDTHAQTAASDGRDVFMLDTLPVDVDLLILAVPDNEIQNVAANIADNAIRSGISFGSQEHRPVVTHLAGRYGLEPLAPLADLGFLRMAWHPMQSFTCSDKVPEGKFNSIHVGVTADEDAWPVAVEMARLLGAHPIRVAAEDRIRYHHACVLASNFLPILMELGATRLQGIVENEREAIEALLPLVKGMVRNLEPDWKKPPAEEWGWESFQAMSGPVRRGDLKAVLSHLEEWNDPLGKDVYRVLTVAAARLASRAGIMSQEEQQNWENALFS